MNVIVKSLLMTCFLVSCGTTEESRYRSTEDLERPPTVASSPSKEQRIVDDSSIPKKKDRTGLGLDVYQNTPTQLTIKQPFDEAWNTLGRALKQSGLKITDHEKDKGLYYVTQETEETSGFFAKATAFFSHDASTYLLTVKPLGEETTVTATIANASEQNSSAAKDGVPEASAASAEDLLQQLFKTLRDTLEE